MLQALPDSYEQRPVLLLRFRQERDGALRSKSVAYRCLGVQRPSRKTAGTTDATAQKVCALRDKGGYIIPFVESLLEHAVYFLTGHPDARASYLSMFNPTIDTVKSESDHRKTRFLLILIALLSVAYLVQIGSPLRLNSDSIHFLSVAASAADGEGFVHRGEPTRYPLGYPALLAGLDRVGLGVSWAFVGLNVLFIGLGLAASYFLFVQAFNFDRWIATLLCCLILLSHVLIREFSFPMSDVPFFGVAIACLLPLVWSQQRQGARRWFMIGIAGILIAAAISIRTIGIALIPALLWVCLPDRDRFRALPAHTRKRLIIVYLLAVVVVALGVGYLVIRSEYFGMLVNGYGELGVKVLVVNLEPKLTEWSDMIVNVDRSRVPLLLRGALPFIGFLGFSTMLFGMWLRRRHFGPIEIFVLAYAAILFIWPGYHARFWLGVMPLSIGFVALVLHHIARHKILRKAVVVYVVGFMLAGIGALGYTSRITFAGAAFPDRYKAGFFKETYRAAFNGLSEPEIVRENEQLQEAFDALIRYEPRAHPSLKNREPRQ